MKRLHISGLQPDTTPEILGDRFKSFGTVIDVSLPKSALDGMFNPFYSIYLNTWYIGIPFKTMEKFQSR